MAIILPQITSSFLLSSVISAKYAGPDMVIAAPFLAIDGIYLIALIVNLCKKYWS